MMLYIGKAKREDISDIYDLINEGSDVLWHMKDFTSIARVETMVEKSLDDHDCRAVYVVKDHHGVVATVVVSPKAKKMNISHIATHPQQRNKGYASTLIEKMEIDRVAKPWTITAGRRSQIFTDIILPKWGFEEVSRNPEEILFEHPKGLGL